MTDNQSQNNTTDNNPDSNENKTNQNNNTSNPSQGQTNPNSTNDTGKNNNGNTNNSSGNNNSGNTTPSKPTPTPPPEPTPTPEVPKEKSIYEYPYDINTIKQKLIEIGEHDMGWKHITHYSDGTLRTQHNSTWLSERTITKGMDAKIVERSLLNYIRGFTYEFIESLGGHPIKYFTIYIEEQQNGFIVYLCI